MTDSIDMYYTTLSELKFVFTHTHTHTRLGFAFMRHSLARMPIYKFMDYSFNLAIAPWCIERELCWWAVGREWRKASLLFSTAVEMMAIFRMLQVKHTVASFISIRVLCALHVRNGNMLINRTFPEYHHNVFNSPIDFLNFGIASCV